MDLGVAGLRVLVTAGAAGIGLGIARAFMREGAKVHVCDVDKDALAAIKTSDPRIGQSMCDVADRASVATLFDTAIADLGGLDVLVNNAGIGGPTGRVEEIHPEDWDRCVAVCLTGQFNCARLAVPHLRQSRKASIVFTKSLSIELGGDGIRVNAILPGIVAGDRQRRVLEAKAQQLGLSYADMEKRAFSFTSIKEYVTAEQLADQIVFIASPRGRTISGQAISVDGDTGMLS
jgi:NAD(P)-dependent dehydrogenase (short-subunit alcohol dehydrogenase family)